MNAPVACVKTQFVCNVNGPLDSSQQFPRCKKACVGATIIRILGCAILVLVATGCSPSVTYRRVEMEKPLLTTPDPANPARREVAFALQSSTILVTLTEEQRTAAKAGNECEAKDCIESANFTVAADSDRKHIYLAALGRGTKVSVTATDNDPLLPKSVTQSFADPAAAAIAQIAKLAVAGVTAGGSWVAFAAIAVGTVGFDYRARDQMAGIECPGGRKSALPKKQSVRLPWIIEKAVPDTDWPSTAEDASLCWHAVASPEDSVNAGWFYRIIDNRSFAPRGFPPTLDDPVASSIFARSDELSAAQPKDYWPATACRRVILEVSWWKSLVDKRAEDTIHKELVVSDPEWIQMLTLTKDGRTITLRPSCGGYATSSAAVEQASIVEAILKGYNDYKDAKAKGK